MRRQALLGAALGLLIAAPSWAADLYVDRQAPGASDGNPGTEAQPWLTIQHAADLAQAGDTVHVKQGTYNERVVIKSSGSPTAKITFIAFPGHRPIIDGAGVPLPDWEGLVQVEDYNHIVIEGFEIRSAEGQLFKANNTQHVTLRGCLIHGNEGETTEEHGVHFTRSSFGEILGNEVHTTNQNAICAEVCSDMTIEGNYVHDNPAHNCIDLKNGGDAVTMPRNNIRFNWLTGCSNGILSAYQSDQQILGNVITNNDRSCIWFIDTGAPASPYVANSSFVNNTCVDNAWDGVQNDRAQSLTIKNNIFSNTRREISFSSTAAVGQLLDHNLYRVGAIWRIGGTTYSTLAAWGASMGNQEAQSQVADPLFNAPGSHDYSLKLGSPAINKGEDLGASLNQGLSSTSSWPDQVALLDQYQHGNGWEIGAYIYTDPNVPDGGIDAAVDAGPPVDSIGGDHGPAVDSGPPAEASVPPDGAASEGPRADGPGGDGPRVDGPRVDGPRADGPRVDIGEQLDGPATARDASGSEGAGQRSILRGGCSYGQISSRDGWLLLLLLLLLIPPGRRKRTGPSAG